MMPHNYEGESGELLDYETEQQPPEQVAPTTPIPVCVDSPVVTVPTIAQHVTCRTFVLADATPAQILPLDPLRTAARLSALDTDVVLCHSLVQAQNPANTDVTLASPDGAVISSCAPSPNTVSSTQPMWIVANTFPARVSVIIERRTA